MTDEIKQAIQLLEENGYKITAPPKEVKDEYTFDRAWNLYDKKVGCKAKLEKKWNSMSKKDRNFNSIKVQLERSQDFHPPA